MTSLRVWLKEGHTVEIIRRKLPEFEAATGINVAIEIVPEHVAHDELLAGDGRPDVVTCPYWYLDELLAAGALRPVACADVRRQDQDFPPIAIEALSRNGSLYAIPHTLTGGVLSYRKDLLAELGRNKPQTLSDVLETATAQRGDIIPMLARCNAEFSSFETYAGWAAAKRIRLLPDEGMPTLDDLERGVGDLLVTLRDASKGRALTAETYAQLGDEMAEGNALMLLDTSAWPFLFEAADSPVRGAMGYSVIRDRLPAQFVYAEGLAITSWSTRAADAAAFIAWRHSPDVVLAEIHEVGRFDLPRLDVRREPWFARLAAERDAGEWLRVIDEAWAAADLGHVAFRPDYVRRARELMTLFGAVIDGSVASLAEGFSAIEAQEPR